MKIARDDNAIHFHSKGGRCKFWGLIHYADRRLPQWAYLDGPQHDRSSSDTVMISMNFETYSSLAIFFIICFVLFLNTKLYILNECYQCLIFITVRNLQSKTRTVHFVFSFRIFVFTFVIIKKIVALGMFTNLCLVLLLRLAVSFAPKFHFQLTKKS